MKQRKFTIGITGNAGSGKSTVARLFRTYGAHLVDADAISRDVLARHIREVVETFGPDVVGEGGIDRRKLAERVFLEGRAEELTEILAEDIIRELQVRVEKAPPGPVVVDAPLLFEYRMEDAFDVLVLVTAPREVLIRRLMERAGYSRELAEAILNSQIPDEEKRDRVDFVIVNDGNLEDLEREARRVWEAMAEGETEDEDDTFDF